MVINIVVPKILNLGDVINERARIGAELAFTREKAKRNSDLKPLVEKLEKRFSSWLALEESK